MLSSFRHFLKGAAVLPRYEQGLAGQRHERPMRMQVAAGYLAPQHRNVDELYQQLRKADDRFKAALIQLTIAKKLFAEARAHRIENEQLGFPGEIQASLMQNFCSLLAEKEDQRIRYLEKTLYLGPISREEMAQRRVLRRQQMNHPLECEEAIFTPTLEIQFAQEMANGASYDAYIQAYKAQEKALKIVVSVENTIGQVQGELAQRLKENKMLPIAPGGIEVPNASFSLNDVNQLAAVVIDVAKLDQLSIAARCARCAKKIEMSFVENLLKKAKQQGKHRQIQAWNAVLHQLLERKSLNQPRDGADPSQDNVRKTPRIYALAHKIFVQLQRPNPCISDITERFIRYEPIEEEEKN